MIRGGLAALVVAVLAAPPARAFVPFPSLDYSLTPERLNKECRAARARASSRLEAIATLSHAAANFANGPEALDAVVSELMEETVSHQFLKYVSISSRTRDAAHECETGTEKFLVETYSRPDLYRALKLAASKKERLEGEPGKLQEKTLLDFKRSGLDLSAEDLLEVKNIKLRLSELGLQFGKNLNEVKDSMLFSREELAGLPADFIARLKTEGEQYRVTLDYPDYLPFMNNAKNPGARKLLESLFSNRAHRENLPLIAEALRLRQKAAKLLDYPSHAHFVLSERMARTPEAARGFLERLENRLKPQAKKELAVLLELKKADEGDRSDGIIHAWDWRYYDNQLKVTRYAVDEEALKEYFPMSTVTAGMLSVYQTLLGVSFRELPEAALWHPQVKLYAVSNAPGGEPLAYFYMDLYPREGKYKHAAAFPLISGRRRADGSYQAPVSAMVANFNQPAEGRPSLLTHKEVRTFFHEFGHIMHQSLTKARYGRFSGTNVTRDFLEAPSQMLENWIWSADILSNLSGHYQNPTKKLPRELLDKMIEAKNVNAGLSYLRQIFFGLIDLRYHGTGVIEDTTDEYSRLMKKVSLIPLSPETHPEAGFGHLFSGYDSGYYGYLWSEVFAQDMFSRFEEAGLLNALLGRHYRESILESGGSRDEAVSLRQFLGRKPNEKAFLKSIGLTEPERGFSL